MILMCWEWNCFKKMYSVYIFGTFCAIWFRFSEEALVIHTLLFFIFTSCEYDVLPLITAIWREIYLFRIKCCKRIFVIMKIPISFQQSTQQYVCSCYIYCFPHLLCTFRQFTHTVRYNMLYNLQPFGWQQCLWCLKLSVYSSAG